MMALPRGRSLAEFCAARSYIIPSPLANHSTLLPQPRRPAMPDDTPQPAKVAPVTSESDSAVPDETTLDASTSTAQPAASVARTNSLSKMRSHRGNVPTLPQTKLCPLCPAKFTRTTHLNRHLKTRKSALVPMPIACVS